MYRKKLADTLEKISQDGGVNDWYQGGSLGKDVVDDIQELGD